MRHLQHPVTWNSGIYLRLFLTKSRKFCTCLIYFHEIFVCCLWIVNIEVCFIWIWNFVSKDFFLLKGFSFSWFAVQHLNYLTQVNIAVVFLRCRYFGHVHGDMLWNILFPVQYLLYTLLLHFRLRIVTIPSSKL